MAEPPFSKNVTKKITRDWNGENNDITRSKLSGDGGTCNNPEEADATQRDKQMHRQQMLDDPRIRNEFVPSMLDLRMALIHPELTNPNNVQQHMPQPNDNAQTKKQDPNNPNSSPLRVKHSFTPEKSCTESKAASDYAGYQASEGEEQTTCLLDLPPQDEPVHDENSQSNAEPTEASKRRRATSPESHGLLGKCKKPKPEHSKGNATSVWAANNLLSDYRLPAQRLLV